MRPHEPSSLLFSKPREIRLEADWRQAGETLRATLRPNLNLDEFLVRRTQLLTDGYRLVGIFNGSQAVCVGSFTVSPHAVLGRELLIHDMATLPEFERGGLGSSLLAYLEATALFEKCGRVFVHTRKMSSFYVKNGFDEYSTGLVKQLEG